MVIQNVAMTMSVSEFTALCVAPIDNMQKHGGELAISKYGCGVAPLVVEEDKPWLALRGKGRFLVSPLSPAVSEQEIEALR